MVYIHKIVVLLLQLISLFPAPTLAKDDTLKRWAKGRDVTEAVLRKISKSQIFSQDTSFLLRLAYVESQFGEDDSTFRTSYFGGIWQVEESVFEITKNSSSTLSPLHKQILSSFQIDWTEVTWKQLIIPLYSGLAVALYFTGIAEGKHLPQTLPDQIAHWKKYYRPVGSSDKFKQNAGQLQNQSKCRGKLDLCVVLDGSGSIGDENYQKAKDFVATIIESFSLEHTRIAMIVFSNEPTTVFELNNGKNIKQLANLAKTAIYPDAGTRTDLGINHAIEMFIRSPNAQDNGVPKIMIVFTDGESNSESDMNGAVARIRKNNINSLSIGIGPSINPAELLQIALDDQNKVFQLADFAALQDFLQKISSVTCEAHQEPTLNTTYEDTLKRLEKRFYHLKIPSEGMTINVTEINGKTKGYWSLTDEAPSEAVHDGTLKSGPNFISPSPNRPRVKRDIEEEDRDDLSDVYITVEGIEEINDYTLSFVEGNQAGIGDESGAEINSLVKFTILFFTFLHIAFN